MNSDTGIREAVLTEIRDLAEKYGLERVVLFGSRARGDYKKTSDIDLAVTGGNITLFTLDVVNLDGSVQEELRKSIEQEGRLLYEKI